jgi:hypothetical protein
MRAFLCLAASPGAVVALAKRTFLVTDNVITYNQFHRRHAEVKLVNGRTRKHEYRNR